MNISQTPRTLGLAEAPDSIFFYPLSSLHSWEDRGPDRSRSWAPSPATTPGSPASLAHRRTEVTSFPCVVLQWERWVAALTPTVPSLAFTPHK